MAVNIGPFQNIVNVSWASTTPPVNTPEDPLYIVVYLTYIYYGIGFNQYPCRTDPPPTTNIFDARPFTDAFDLLPTRYAPDTGLIQASASGGEAVTNITLDQIAVTGYPTLMPAPISSPDPYAWLVQPNILSYDNPSGPEVNTHQRLSSTPLTAPIGQPDGLIEYYDRGLVVAYTLYDWNWTSSAYCNEYGWIWKDYISGLGPQIGITFVNFGDIEVTFLPTGKTYKAVATAAGSGATGTTPVLCRRVD